MKYHCLFEQSGTFKNEFKKLGFESFDYDILNNFGETDFQIDLFQEITAAYNGESSLFDRFKPNEDYILAFFPCTRFEDQSIMLLNCNHVSMIKKPEEDKLLYSLKIHSELNLLFEMLCKFCIVILRKGIRCMIENPYSTQHYLTRYFPIKPKIIDKDRTLNGDYYEKPTQYYFLNCEPENNFIFEPIQFVELQKVKVIRGNGNANRYELRSIIHPQYANRFIRSYIIKE